MSEGGPLWAGRFSTPPAPEAHALGRSLHFDERLGQVDVRASRAHVGALMAAGLLTADEAETLDATLAEVGEGLASGTVVFGDADEDIHSVVEHEVTQRSGALGAKLHAGRSRNDLVVTDLRLWLLDAGARIDGRIAALVSVLVERAREHEATVMPGTTHARLAQPVTLGHHLLAHAWACSRDLERLAQWADRASTSALGAGAMATSTLGLDPAATAERLGLRRAFANSIDAVSDRDFVQEFLAVASISATHLSRLAADLVRWTDESLAWAELDEAYSTGSSMMPQKRNPDTAELARGKAARVVADFVTVSALLHGLPAGYQRDLQEDKEALFDAVDTLDLVVPAITGAMATVRFDVPVMRDACAAEGLYATDLAEALVKAGVPFREAHRRTGVLLRELAGRGGTLASMTDEEWEAFGVPGGRALLDPDASVAAHATPGGPSTQSVRTQADALEAFLAGR